MTEVVHLFPGTYPASDCPGCGGEHRELGMLCGTCRVKQRPTDISNVQADIASAIQELRRFQAQGAPLSGPLASALEAIQRAYDGSEPLVQIRGRGYVELVGGELWAFPEAGVSIGPFSNEETAQYALTKYGEANEARKAVT